jgi:hypothetical protein
MNKTAIFIPKLDHLGFADMDYKDRLIRSLEEQVELYKLQQQRGEQMVLELNQRIAYLEDKLNGTRIYLH